MCTSGYPSRENKDCVPDKGRILARPVSWNVFKEKKPSSEGRTGCLEEHPPHSRCQNRVMLLSNTDITVLELFFTTFSVTKPLVIALPGAAGPVQSQVGFSDARVGC